MSSFGLGAAVVLDRYAVSMLVTSEEFLLTEEPGPTWLEPPACTLRGEEVCIILDEWTSPTSGEVYYRLLAPRGVGWIHDYYVEPAE